MKNKRTTKHAIENFLTKSAFREMMMKLDALQRDQIDKVRFQLVKGKFNTDSIDIPAILMQVVKDFEVRVEDVINMALYSAAIQLGRKDIFSETTIQKIIKLDIEKGAKEQVLDILLHT